VPGTLAGDGEPIDAYLLGVHKPVVEATGRVIALIVRNDDAEDKLVVAPVEGLFSATEIRDIVNFQEHYFDSRVVMHEAGS
jgi:inorganic pyrophosphatase